MTLDRFVDWKGAAPDVEEIRRLLTEYVDGMSLEIRLHKTRFCVELFSYYHMYDERSERLFEVFFSQQCVDVITRDMDDVTCAIATGFAELAARTWNGELRT